MICYKILILIFGFLLTVLIPLSSADESWFENLRGLEKAADCNGKDKDRIEFYGKPCNYTKYDNTSYAESWRLADRQIYKEAEKLFNKWIKERCNKTKDKEWRQEVCDGWSLNLLGCILSNASDTESNATCGCLQTKLTEFEPRNSTNPSPLTVCRVKKGKKCSQETTALHCSDKRVCEASICSASPSLCIQSKIFKVLMFIVNVYIFMTIFQRHVP